MNTGPLSIDKPSSLSFRKIDSGEQVAYFLQCVFKSAGEVLVWQRPHKAPRVLWTAHIVSLEKSAKRFDIVSTSGDFSGEFSTNLPIYFKAETEEMLFKTSIVAMKKDRIVLKIPSTVQVIEKRSAARTSFYKNLDKKSVLLRDIQKREYKAKLYDLSLRGAGIILERNHARFFYKDDVVILQTEKNSYPLVGRLVHIAPFNVTKGSSKYYRLGIKFHQEASLGAFEYYCRTETDSYSMMDF